jgi:hypothetical protein
MEGGGGQWACSNVVEMFGDLVWCDMVGHTFHHQCKCCELNGSERHTSQEKETIAVKISDQH